jgi:hypothetical protein
MDFQIPINLKPLPTPISYRDKILLVGSCFTEHIGGRLQELKFSVLQNPNGILFDPMSVCNSISSYIEKKEYTAQDLFYRDELWQSWQHHSKFSGVDLETVLSNINESQHEACEFIRNANWLIITLGSSFSYRLKSDEAPSEGSGTAREVANCHRAPGQWFWKYLMEIEETFSALSDTIQRLHKHNPGLKIIFTISPVRHIRDGVIENNRSKARLIEAVHQIVNLYEHAYYFPAYELVIDVLRDYRFYDIDLVHPNYPATEFVFEKFTDSCIDDAAKQLIPEIKRIANAYKHKAFQPNTIAHRQFLQSSLEKAAMLQQQFPFLDLKEEIAYFSRM